MSTRARDRASRSLISPWPTGSSGGFRSLLMARGTWRRGTSRVVQDRTDTGRRRRAWGAVTMTRLLATAGALPKRMTGARGALHPGDDGPPGVCSVACSPPTLPEGQIMARKSRRGPGMHACRCPFSVVRPPRARKHPLVPASVRRRRAARTTIPHGRDGRAELMYPPMRMRNARPTVTACGKNGTSGGRT